MQSGGKDRCERRALQCCRRGGWSRKRQGHGGPEMVTWLGPHVRVESFILSFLAETQFSYLCTRGKPSVRPSQPEGMVAEPLIQLCEQCQVCGRGQSCLPCWPLTHPFIIASGSEFIFIKILSPRLQKLLDKAAWWLERKWTFGVSHDFKLSCCCVLGVGSWRASDLPEPWLLHL